MALTDIAATSAFGPNNPGKKGTGTTLGPNNIPTANKIAPLQVNSLEFDRFNFCNSRLYILK